MIERIGAALVLALLSGGAGYAQQPPAQPAAPPAGQTPGGQPAPATPSPQAPGAPPAPQVPPAATPVAATGPTCPLPTPPATLPARSFTGANGMLMYQVVPTRVADFELLLDYVRDALAKTTNATIGKQAAGWKFYRSQEPGPNGDVLYVFLFDPAVPCVEYGFFPILSSVYTDPALLTELHKLYTGAVRTGGTLLNLLPLAAQPPRPLAPAGTPATAPPGKTPVPGAQTPADPASRVPIQGTGK